MKIQILSDLHTEFFQEPRRRLFWEGLRAECDVVVLAGDVATVDSLDQALGWFCQHYPQVVYVAGNHEFYRSSLGAVRQKVQTLARRLDNLHFLDNEAVELAGQRFVGTTLWFPDGPDNEAYSVMLNDFNFIEDFHRQVYLEADRANAFLQAEVQPGDVVVTHHLPSLRSVHQQHLDSPLTRFFVYAQDALVERRCPALWIHGHTHINCDYAMGQTRVLCNPYGYRLHEENVGFEPQLVVEL